MMLVVRIESNRWLIAEVFRIRPDLACLTWLPAEKIK